jgi:two-component system, NarL family, response regulator DevR
VQEGELTKVFLVDDHDIVRLGVRSLVEAEDDMTVVGEARTAGDAILGLLERRPDIAVLDARLPDGSGIDLCARLRELAPEIRCLILTSSDDEETIQRAIEAGALGYVLKQIEASSLVSGIRLVARGHSLVDPVVAARVVGQVQARRAAASALSDLTPQQRAVLELLPEGITNREIGERLGLSEKTVKNHLTGLMRRLGVQHRTQAAMIALRLSEDGYDGEAPGPRRAAEPSADR